MSAMIFLVLLTDAILKEDWVILAGAFVQLRLFRSSSSGVAKIAVTTNGSREMRAMLNPKSKSLKSLGVLTVISDVG